MAKLAKRPVSDAMMEWGSEFCHLCNQREADFIMKWMCFFLLYLDQKDILYNKCIFDA